ncbi:hypothetical protein [Kitasatospora azatica]|nr:hypothetical protein [Kitasatospora azatica]
MAQAQPDRVRPRAATTSPVPVDGRLGAQLPPVSWNVLRFTPTTG